MRHRSSLLAYVYLLDTSTTCVPVSVIGIRMSRHDISFMVRICHSALSSLGKEWHELDMDTPYESVRGDINPYLSPV